MTEKLVDTRYLLQVLQHTKLSATALLQIENQQARPYSAEEVCHILVVAEFIKRVTPPILIHLANNHNEVVIVSDEDRDTFIAVCKVLKDCRNKFAHAILFANHSTNGMFVQNLHLAFVLNAVVELVETVTQNQDSFVAFSEQLQQMMEVSSKLYGAFSYEFAGSKDLYELFRLRLYLQTIITKFDDTKPTLLGRSSYFSDALKLSWELYTFLEESQYTIMAVLKSVGIVIPIHSVYLNLERTLLNQDKQMLEHLIHTVFPLIITHLDTTITRISYSLPDKQLE